MNSEFVCFTDDGCLPDLHLKQMYFCEHDSWLLLKLWVKVLSNDDDSVFGTTHLNVYNEGSEKRSVWHLHPSKPNLTPLEEGLLIWFLLPESFVDRFNSLVLTEYKIQTDSVIGLDCTSLNSSTHATNDTMMVYMIHGSKGHLPHLCNTTAEIAFTDHLCNDNEQPSVSESIKGCWDQHREVTFDKVGMCLDSIHLTEFKHDKDQSDAPSMMFETVKDEFQADELTEAEHHESSHTQSKGKRKFSTPKIVDCPMCTSQFSTLGCSTNRLVKHIKLQHKTNCDSLLRAVKRKYGAYV